MPGSPVTVSYRVEPLVDGTRLPISRAAEVEWTDSLGLTGKAPIPDVFVDVEMHTATPTNTATNTPTATPTSTATPTHTPTPAPRYLPVVRKNWPPPLPTPTVCVPELQTMDVALVVDTSTSMSDATSAGGRPKIDAAVDAGEALVQLLKADDQAAVVGFNATATLLTELTADKAAARDGLSRLKGTQATGTSIYRGLLAARDELVGPRHKATHNRSIVLVTDGQHNDPEFGLDEVRRLAAEIRAADITIVVVGLGDDIDEALLREIAAGPDYYFAAPDSEDLLDIYRQIVNLIPCP